MFLNVTIRYGFKHLHLRDLWGPDTASDEMNGQSEVPGNNASTSLCAVVSSGWSPWLHPGSATWRKKRTTVTNGLANLHKRCGWSWWSASRPPAPSVISPIFRPKTYLNRVEEWFINTPPAWIPRAKDMKWTWETKENKTTRSWWEEIGLNFVSGSRPLLLEVVNVGHHHRANCIVLPNTLEEVLAAPDADSALCWQMCFSYFLITQLSFPSSTNSNSNISNQD